MQTQKCIHGLLLRRRSVQRLAVTNTLGRVLQVWQVSLHMLSLLVWGQVPALTVPLAQAQSNLHMLLTVMMAREKADEVYLCLRCLPSIVWSTFKPRLVAA